MRRLFVVLLLVLASVASVAAAKEQEFRLKKPDAQSVTLMGEFNGWRGQPMTKGSDGTWTTKVTLPAGTHAYKFLINGSDWILDPENPKRKTADGVENSAIEVKEGSTSSPVATSSATPAATSTPAAPAAAPSSGGNLDFNVVADRTRYDFDRTGHRSTVTVKEKWGYKVTLENRSFKTVDGAEVQYRQFKLDDAVRGGAKLVGIGGSTTMSSLRTGQKFSFETTPMELERMELRPGWVWTDEELKRKVKDGLAGIWLRVMHGGNVVFEWQQPADLKNNAKWE